jgi:hypothetical protein
MGTNIAHRPRTSTLGPPCCKGVAGSPSTRPREVASREAARAQERSVTTSPTPGTHPPPPNGRRRRRLGRRA